MLLYACGNGSSEMVTNLSNAVITFLFNQLMLSLLGEDGVAAITIVLYAQFLLTALYMGFSMGVAPVISFNYGAANHARLQRVFRCCLGFIALSSALVFGASLGLAELVVAVFSPAGTAVHTIALDGFYKFAPAFLFARAQSVRLRPLHRSLRWAGIRRHLLRPDLRFSAAGPAAAARRAGGRRSVDRRSLRGAGLLGPLYRLPGGQAKQISLCMNRKRTRRDLVKENSSSHPYRHGNGWGSFLVPLQIM